MRLIVDPVAAEELERQLDYLVDRSAVAAAVRLEARFSSFLEQFLSLIDRVQQHPLYQDHLLLVLDP